MKNLIATLLIASTISFGSVAAPNAGFSDVTNNGGGSYTFTFDTITSDIDGNAEGLFFSSGDGLDLTVFGSSTVRQDAPSNGGLGILGGSDNLEVGLREWISFSFSEQVSLTGFTLNGTVGSNGHTVDASGLFGYYGTGDTSVYNWYDLDAQDYDGIGTDSAIAANEIDYLRIFQGKTAPCKLNCTTPDYFAGYVESITVQTAGVPEPPMLALFAIALIGLAGSGIKRLKQKFNT